MTLRLTSHLHARVTASFLGFFGGGAVFVLFVFGNPDVHFGLTALLFFGLVFGGIYLAQLAFSLSFPAACPACGAASAVPTLRLPSVYFCRTCGATISAAQARHAEQLTLMRTRAVRQQESESPLVWMFVIVGVGLVGFAIWLFRRPGDPSPAPPPAAARIMRRLRGLTEVMRPAAGETTRAAA